MLSFGRFRQLAAAVVVAVLLVAPRPAQATIEIDYSIDGGARTFGASSTTQSVTFSSADVGSAGLFNIDLTFGKTNSPNTNGPVATLTQSNNTVTALYSDTSVTHTLHIYVSADGYTSPKSPPVATLASSSATNTLGGSVDVVFTSYVDVSNTLFGTATGATPAVKYSVSGQNGTGGGPATFALLNVSATPFSMTNIGDYKLSGGTNITVVSGNTTLKAVPAPTGMVLALMGLPCLGLRFLRRRTAV